MVDIKDLRYIVFMINPETQQYFGSQRINTHDGEIFCSLKDAQEYAINAVEERHCTRFLIGVFTMDSLSERIGITFVETFGFRYDKKNINQLDLFQSKDT
jgi:hypothetical protein